MDNQNLNTLNESKEEYIEIPEKVQYTIARLELTVGNGFNFGFGFGLAMIVIGLIMTILGFMGAFAFFATLTNAIKPF